MTFEGEPNEVNLGLASTDSINLDYTVKYKNDKNDNNDNAIVSSKTSSKINFFSSKISKRFKRRNLKRSNQKGLNLSSLVLNKVKRVSHKSKSNFLNDFEIDSEQNSALRSNSDKLVSNYDIFQLGADDLSDANFQNIFQPITNGKYSKLLPWEKNTKRK